jgi:hypothetical protein
MGGVRATIEKGNFKTLLAQPLLFSRSSGYRRERATLNTPFAPGGRASALAPPLSDANGARSSSDSIAAHATCVPRSAGLPA